MVTGQLTKGDDVVSLGIGGMLGVDMVHNVGTRQGG